MHPILFHLGRFEVHSYGVLLMIAFLASIARVQAAARAGRAPGVSADDALDAGIWMIVAGIIGARLLFVALDWSYYRGSLLDAAAIWNGGVSFHGAMIGGLLALIAFCVRRKIPFLTMADLCAPSAMIGYAIGRVGCFFNGCCYGTPTTMPWGVRFFDDNHWTPPSHPTQLYATAMSLVFLALLVRLERHKSYPGQVFCAYLLFSGIERFVMEIWRAGVTSGVVAFGLTDTQLFCLALIAGALAGMALLRGRAPRVREAAQP